MERRKSFMLMFLAAISVFLPRMESQVAPLPLCSSQLALVNYACSQLPIIPYAPPLSSSLNSSLDEPGNGNRNMSGHENHHHHHHHNHDHDDDDHHRRRHDHDHHHHHHHRHHDHDHDHDHEDDDHHYHGSPVEANCCHWLNELDAECVCEMLVHLPVFLAKPAHQYTVIVDDSCNVTYTCRGRIRP